MQNQRFSIHSLTGFGIMQPKPVVLLDACVLYPYHLRDFLIHLSFTSKLYFPKWTTEIQNEWSRNLIKNHPATSPKKVSRIQNLMNMAIPDALIPEKNYKHRINSLSLPDKDDRHVLAAAISEKHTPPDERVEAIITFNLKDFPKETLNLFSLQAITPDNLVIHLLQNDRSSVIKALYIQASIMKSPPRRPSEVSNGISEKLWSYKNL